MTFTRRIVIFALSAAAVAAVSGCTGRATYGATVSGKTSGYAVASYHPTMVPVREEVWVVEGRSHPVFYSHGHYWRYDSGVWYRSSYVNDGYVRVRAHVVPRPIRRIDRPRRYRHYRADTRVRVRQVPREHIHVRSTRDRDQYRDRRHHRDRDRYEGRRHRGRGVGHHRGRGRGHRRH